jgi:hypothetical protein
MKTLKIPGFTADHALTAQFGRYRIGQLAASNQNTVIPAIPACRNCDAILDRCESNGWRPRAVCNACASGNCYEVPPMPDPFPNPFDSGPPHWIFN